ncbi:hypothetical protein KKH36_03910 [Patescibacteria group bacterium]|nr:hypothetical protein [Patescibacteria group bacterium]
MITPNQVKKIIQIKKTDEVELRAKRYTGFIDRVEYYFVEYKGKNIREPQQVIRVDSKSLSQIKYLLEKWWWRIKVIDQNILLTVLPLFLMIIITLILEQFEIKISINELFIGLILSTIFFIIHSILRIYFYKKILKRKMESLLTPYGNFKWDEVGTIKFTKSKYIVLDKNQNLSV